MQCVALESFTSVDDVMVDMLTIDERSLTTRTTTVYCYPPTGGDVFDVFYRCSQDSARVEVLESRLSAWRSEVRRRGFRTQVGGGTPRYALLGVNTPL